MQSSGYGRGETCTVCKTYSADSGQTVCYRCRNRIQAIDRAACDSRAIRRDMLEQGIPPTGMEGAFSGAVQARAMRSQRAVPLSCRWMEGT